MNTAFRIYRVDKAEGVRVFLMCKTNFADLEDWRDGPESNSQGLTGATGYMMGVRRDESPFSISSDHRIQAIGYRAISYAVSYSLWL